jgi:hypothetical protein
MLRLNLTAMVVLFTASMVGAASITFDAPSTDASYVLLSDNGSATVVPDPDSAQSDQCLKLFQLSPSDATHYVRIRSFDAVGPLSMAGGSWRVFLPTTNVADLRPYMYFGVDTNGDPSSTEAWVIQWSSGAENAGKGYWYSDHLGDDIQVHVWGDRGDLGPGATAGQGEYSVYNSSLFQDPDYGLLGTLKTEWYDEAAGVRWGDLGVTSMTVGTGAWPNVDSDIVAYVDDIEFTPAVPEPMTMLAFGSAVAGLGGYIRRRRRA